MAAVISLVAAIIVTVLLLDLVKPAPEPASTPRISTATTGGSPPASTTSSPPASSPTPTPTPTPDAADESVCNLPSGTDEPTSAGPEATWEFQGTTAYPTSEEYGPGAEDPAGFRYCFQRSPIGALFFAANAYTQGFDPSVKQAWGEYAFGEGPHRAKVMKQGRNDDDTAASEARVALEGFRILAFSESSARVDLGVKVSLNERAAYISVVYDLVWQAGDWKISTDSTQPISYEPLKDLGGFIPWGSE